MGKKKKKKIVKLFLIPEPAPNTRAIFIYDTPDSRLPLFNGKGHIDLLCRTCELVLAENMSPGNLVNVVFQCPRCSSFNDTEPPERTN